MYTLPPPLGTAEFYILLALARRQLHAYSIMGQVQKDSLDSLILKPGRFYPLLARLHDEGLIDMMGNKPAGKSGKDRMHYAISPLGKIRLQEEFQRLHHAVEIIQHSGLAPTQTPTDIQRLMLGLASAGT